MSKVFNHPLYNKKTLDYDIAVLKLSRPVKYTKYIRPACVPPSGFKVDSGKEAFVSGWGKTAEGGSSSPVLQVAKVGSKPLCDSNELDREEGVAMTNSIVMNCLR